MTDPQQPPSFKVNPISSFINGVINAIVSGGEKALEAYITAQAPIFTNPIFHDLLDDVVETVGSDISVAPKTLVDFLVTDFQSNHENSVLIAAMKKLQSNPGSDQDAINAWGAVIHNDGAGNPSV